MKNNKIVLFNSSSKIYQELKNMFLGIYEIINIQDSTILKEILTSNDRPNLILFDSSFEDDSIYKVAKDIKSDARTSETPIIFLIDSKDKPSVQKSFESGAVDCISKPIFFEELQAKIKNILQLFNLRNSLSNALEDRQRHLVTVERQLIAIDEHMLYISIDLDTNIKNVSTALVKLLHCSKQDFIKKNKHCLSKKEFGEKKIKEIFDIVHKTGVYKTELYTKTTQEDDIYLSVTVAKDLDYFDKHIGYMVIFSDITDKKIIEEQNVALDSVNTKLDENLNYLKQFKKAVEEASIFSITDDKGIIKEVNKNFEAISGYSKEELLHNPHNMVRHEDMPSEIFKEMWDTIKSGNIWKGMVKNKRKDGQAYYVMSEIVPVYNNDGTFREFISIRSDITELEEYKQLLKHELDTKNKSLDENINYIEQYEEAINNSMGIIKTDINHTIYDANEKIAELSGYSLDELIGMSSIDLRDEIHKNKEDCQAIGTALSQNKSVSKIMTNVRKNGEKYYLNTVFYPVTNLAGDVVENIQTMYDITELINLNEEIVNTQKEVVFTMGAIGESRSKETGLHVKRVAEYSWLLAHLYGLDEDSCELLKEASPMHDIGKVAIPDSILNKPGKLTSEEFDTMKKHASIGHEMLKYSSRPILRASAEVAYTHHEKYNGKGYPNGLSGEDIPIYGRITAIADVFDALGNNRVYKKAWSLEDILSLFKEQKGEHFDPKLVDIFFEHIDKFLEIRDNYTDNIS